MLMLVRDKVPYYLILITSQCSLYSTGRSVIWLCRWAHCRAYRIFPLIYQLNQFRLASSGTPHATLSDSKRLWDLRSLQHRPKRQSRPLGRKYNFYTVFQAELIMFYSNTAITSQLKAAASGIVSAQAGVDTILQALFTGQTAPANARQQVGDGISAAATALNSAIANSYVFLFLLVDMCVDWVLGRLLICPLLSLVLNLRLQGRFQPVSKFFPTAIE